MQRGRSQTWSGHVMFCSIVAIRCQWKSIRAPHASTYCQPEQSPRHRGQDHHSQHRPAHFCGERFSTVLVSLNMMESAAQIRRIEPCGGLTHPKATTETWTENCCQRTMLDLPHTFPPHSANIHREIKNVNDLDRPLHLSGYWHLSLSVCERN